MKNLNMVIIASMFAVSLAGCSPAPATAELPALDYLIEQLVPELELPAGVQPLGGGGGGGNNGMATDQYFLSDLSIEQVQEFYAGQLAAADWVLISEEDSDAKLVSFWEVTDKAGAVWSGKLEVTFSPPDFPETYLVRVMILQPR